MIFSNSSPSRLPAIITGIISLLLANAQDVYKMSEFQIRLEHVSQMSEKKSSAPPSWVLIARHTHGSFRWLSVTKYVLQRIIRPFWAGERPGKHLHHTRKLVARWCYTMKFDLLVEGFHRKISDSYLFVSFPKFPVDAVQGILQGNLTMRNLPVVIYTWKYFDICRCNYGRNMTSHPEGGLQGDLTKSPKAIRVERLDRRLYQDALFIMVYVVVVIA
jgi:hypothetical protein